MIKDSGNRREFDSGAKRDIQEGKGRCDLLPLEIISKIATEQGAESVHVPSILHNIGCFITNKDINYLVFAIQRFIDFANFNGFPDAMLELSIHYEEGAEKYGERNWEKGIPVHCYIDSGLRHFFKYLRGDTDERHDRAFIWNMVGAMYTTVNYPELFDF